jgi:nucleoside-diphosphate-sugar epimerase
MKRAVVTGATSFIGIYLIQSLLQEDFHVTAVVKPHSEKLHLLPNDKRIQYLALDLSDYRFIHKFIKEAPYVYFSLAWNGTRGMDRDDANLQYFSYICNVQGLESILSTGCKKVITAGSQAEYGLCRERITEKTAENPVSQYGIFKLKFYNKAIELCASNGASLKEPRFFSLYGPQDSEKTMIVSLIKQMIKGEICNLTLGIQKWDFLYVTDAINALITLVQKPCSDGVYNLGSGISKPLKNYVYEIKDILDSKSDLVLGAVPYPTSGIVSLDPDISKIIEETGWAPQVSFKSGILEVIKAIQKQH